jgi:N-acetyl-alpha-D-muramate 1-phosphate uridylyltransferase
MTTLAMIFAAGRGDRMRPLTDRCPKPLLEAGGKPLIVWQIEGLARAGFETIVINHAWLGEQIEARLGDGSQWGVQLRFSAEPDALETAGGISLALPLLETAGAPAVFVAIAGDLYTDFDYASLRPAAKRLANADDDAPGMHLVMVPNPVFHPRGDFSLRDGWLNVDEDAPRLTFGSIGVYDTRMFRSVVPGTKRALTPYYFETIAARRASGERYDGLWRNVGTPAELAEIDGLLRARSKPV